MTEMLLFFKKGEGELGHTKTTGTIIRWYVLLEGSGSIGVSPSNI